MSLTQSQSLFFLLVDLLYDLLENFFGQMSLQLHGGGEDSGHHKRFRIQDDLLGLLEPEKPPLLSHFCYDVQNNFVCLQIIAHLLYSSGDSMLSQYVLVGHYDSNIEVPQGISIHKNIRYYRVHLVNVLDLFGSHVLSLA